LFAEIAESRLSETTSRKERAMSDKMSAADIALLPCPFCGGDAYTSEGCERWFVGCSDCYCNVGEAYNRSGMPEHIYGTETEAITAWNTRNHLTKGTSDD
jgi:hypothetical protein